MLIGTAAVTKLIGCGKSLPEAGEPPGAPAVVGLSNHGDHNEQASIGQRRVMIATPVMAQSVGEKTGVNSVLGIAPKTEDFVKQAAISDMFEIESSKLAEQRADADSKAFAGKMIKDHTETSTELKALVSGGKVKAELPPAMDDAHKSKLEKLQKLNGEDFDDQYDSDQKAAHKDAVSLFERYAKGGENADLKAFASKHLPHLQEHLKMAEGLK